MHMKYLRIFLVSLMCSVLPVQAFAQMTDSQVVEYIKKAAASGKDQKTIASELALRGVTEAQARRIYSQYRQQGEDKSVANQAASGDILRRQTKDDAMNNNLAGDKTTSPETDVFSTMLGENPQEGRSMFSGLEEKNPIFGHNLFDNPGLTFEPNVNAATPDSYVLGPGDELTIEIWGYSEETIRRAITPEGKISISGIGPIQLSGLTIQQASQKISSQLKRRYAGIGGNTSVSVTLSQIRTIQVNVMGDVKNPGTYRLSSFATVFNALYNARGVNQTGSLRDIKVMRGGEEFASVDIYEYLLDGKSSTDITLKEGDVIVVPPYRNIVSVLGSVKRPARYELLDKETLDDVIRYAGGFSGGAYSDAVTIVRQDASGKKVYTVRKEEATAFRMADADEVTVSEGLEKFENKVEVKGFVNRPGLFELGGNIATVRQLVASAGGTTEDAFLGRAVLLREKPDLTLETESVNIGGILSGTEQDILLRKNDVLIISGIFELNDRGILTINGAVASPGEYPFSENTTVEDLIIQAGGLLDGASLARVDVFRRVVDSRTLSPIDTLGRSYSFAIKDGLAMDGGDRFSLEPYDIVTVRNSPGYNKPSKVTISGEVAFPGEYVLLEQEETLSSLIKRAGGLTKHAYTGGATMHRIVSEEERVLRQNIRKMLAQGNTQDSLNVNQIDFDREFSVGIELAKAISHPGSIDDIILREGDKIFVPQNINTVTIQGNVMQPTTVIYKKGKTMNYYVDAAGGYGEDAKKNKVYVIYMNGRVEKARALTKIEPGCEIIVPSKKDTRPISIAEIMSIGTTAASLSTMIATVVNLITK